MSEVFDPIEAFFRRAETNEDYRKATRDAARHFTKCYFNNELFSLVDHGSIQRPIENEAGVEIATAADTLLLEIRNVDADATHIVILAVNADSGDTKNDMQASVRVLGQILKGFERSGKLDSAFAQVMVRSAVAFFIWQGDNKLMEMGQ